MGGWRVEGWRAGGWLAGGLEGGGLDGVEGWRAEGVGEPVGSMVDWRTGAEGRRKQCQEHAL